MESGNNSIFIILFIVASFFGIYAVAKYLGFSLRPDLADRVASRKDNLKLRFKKTFNYYINKLINTIIVFKTRKRLYLISDFEEKRRDKILQRYYILRDSTISFKKYNALQWIYYIFFIFLGIITFIIYNYIIKSDVLIYFIFYFIGITLYIFIIKYKMIEYVIRQQNYKLEEAFGDFFLNQYNILIYNHRKPLERGLNVYKKINKSPDMSLFIHIGLFLIKTTSEEEAINKLIELYEDVTDLSRLLVIEQQLIRGGDDSEVELRGMRAIVLRKKENRIYEKCKQKEYEARIIVWAIMFIVIQVSIAALSYVVQQSGIFTG